MGMIKENDQQLAELRVHYEHLVRTLILDNPDFKSIDESLTARQRLDLLRVQYLVLRLLHQHYYIVLVQFFYLLELFFLSLHLV